MRMSDDDVIMTLFRVLGLMGEGRMDGSECYIGVHEKIDITFMLLDYLLRITLNTKYN